MELSDRLLAVASMVTIGNMVADVGCDHGYIPIYLVKNGISPKVIAMDVKNGPLERAKEHIKAYGMTDYIETRLSNGVAKLMVGEVSTVICAGMGGRLMAAILTEGREIVASLDELILQPQSELPAFRRFLKKEGYRTLNENILCEDGKFYFLFKVCYEKEAVLGHNSEKEAEQVLYEKYGELLLPSG